MLTKHTANKYDTPYKGSFVIVQCFTNGMVNLQCGPTNIRYNIHQIKPYNLDNNIEYSISINMSDEVRILLPVIYFRIKH